MSAHGPNACVFEHEKWRHSSAKRWAKGSRTEGNVQTCTCRAFARKFQQQSQRLGMTTVTTVVALTRDGFCPLASRGKHDLTECTFRSVLCSLFVLVSKTFTTPESSAAAKYSPLWCVASSFTSSCRKTTEESEDWLAILKTLNFLYS